MIAPETAMEVGPMPPKLLTFGGNWPIILTQSIQRRAFAVFTNFPILPSTVAMSPLALELDRVLGRVGPGTAVILEGVVRNAIAVAEQRAAGAAVADNLGYPAGYFESTAGSFAGEPLEAPAELMMQPREPW